MLFSTGCYSGFAVDIGYGNTTFIPVIDCVSIHNLSTAQNIVGKHIYDYLYRKIIVNYSYLNSSEGKRHNYFVSGNVEYKKDRNNSDLKKLPDNNKIFICDRK